jgi:hypothetical protein
VGKQFVEPGRVRAWAVVSFAPPKEITREDVQKFLMILMNCMGNLGELHSMILSELANTYKKGYKWI